MNCGVFLLKVPFAGAGTYRGRIFFKWNKNVRAISAAEVIGIIVAA